MEVLKINETDVMLDDYGSGREDSEGKLIPCGETNV